MQTVKVLEDNLVENLDGLEYDDNFLYTVPKAWSMSDIIDELDLTKIQNNLLCERRCQINLKKCHRLGEHICKRHIG